MIKNAWYSAGWGHELKADVPLARKLFGENLVLFRDKSGKARAVGARCPHRSADMSKGKLIDGKLECPFHGWRFDGDGACRLIPSQPPEAKIPPAACIPSYEIREQQNILWIWPGQSRTSLPDPPYYEKLEAGPKRRFTYARPRCWNGTFMHTIENALDVSHLPIAHYDVVENTRPKEVPPCEITKRDDDRGFFVRHVVTQDFRQRFGDWPMIPTFGSKLFGVRPVVEETYGVDFGGAFYQTDVYDNGKWEFLFALATPADDTHTWFWAMTVRTRAPHFLADWVQQILIEKINDGDQVIVEAMYKNDPAATLREVSVVADRPSLTFRHMHSRLMRKEGRLPIMSRLDEAVADRESEADRPAALAR